MKGFIILLSAIMFIMIGCNYQKKISGIKLKNGTPAYDVAKQIAETYPFLDPDENKVLIDCSSFTVTTGDVIMELNFYFPPLLDVMQKSNNSSKVKEQIRKEAERIAKRRLAAKAARFEGIEISDVELDSILSNFRKVKMRKDELQNYLKDKESYDFLKTLLEEQELLKRYYELKIQERISINEAEIQKEYNSNVYLNLRYVVINSDGRNGKVQEEKFKLINQIKEMLDGGFDFSKVAKKFSEDTETSQSGGIIKGVRHGRFPEEVDKIIFDINEGVISDIIQAGDKYYIFIVDKRVTEKRPYQEVRELYRSQLLMRKRTALQKEIMEELLSLKDCTMINF